MGGFSILLAMAQHRVYLVGDCTGGSQADYLTSILKLSSYA